MGCACHVISRLSYASMVQWAFDAEDNGELVLQVEVTSSATDETCMEVGQRIFKQMVPGLSRAIGPAASKSSRKSLSQVEAVQMKILQSELIMAMGWRWKDGTYACVFTELPCKLQHADHYTGSNLYRAWSNTLYNVPLERERRRRFPFRADMNGADRGQNNGAANRCARWTNPAKLRLDDLGCATHNTHTGVKKQFNIFKPLCSGMTAFALTQKNGGVSTSFRFCLQKTVRAVANPRLNTPPPAADHPWMQHRSRVFDLLCDNDTTKGVEQRMQLEYHFRSNWELRWLMCYCVCRAAKWRRY